jgi:hypothetical protein
VTIDALVTFGVRAADPKNAKAAAMQRNLRKLDLVSSPARRNARSPSLTDDQSIVK